MFKFNLKKNKGPARTCFRGGFTLLEALVATSILMVAVAAPITIAQKGLSSAVYSKNQMIASYLAQDAIEYIKNKRDENFIGNIGNANLDWLAGLGECLDDKSCAIDTKADAGVGEIIEDETGKLKKEKDSEGNFEFYGYSDSGEDTNFTRKINIIEADEVRALITVEVSWGSVENTVTVKTLIYNI